MLSSHYQARPLEPCDFPSVIALCQCVYLTESPYTSAELQDHCDVYPQGQFALVEQATGELAGVHFTLRLDLKDFNIDDPWDILTAGGTFLDHNPQGMTLYGADIMVHPRHQHHGLARVLTDEARDLVVREQLWRLVGASRLPGYSTQSDKLSIQDYVNGVINGTFFDPVLTIHLKDGWLPIRPIHGYLQHDEASAGWAEVMQWLNPQCPPPQNDKLTTD